jgi:DNA-binding NarL/FixJ family response regulator
LKLREQFTHQVLHLVERMQHAPSGPAASRSGLWAEKLTEREREVLQLLAQGYSTDQTAQALSISKATTRNHIQNIYQKLQVHTRAQAVAYAFEHNLVSGS